MEYLIFISVSILPQSLLMNNLSQNMADLPKVIASHNISCKGLNESGRPAFKKDVTVIVNSYDDGTNRVFCRYCYQGANVNNRCNPKLLKIFGKPEENDLKNCIYAKK